MCKFDRPPTVNLRLCQTPYIPSVTLEKNPLNINPLPCICSINCSPHLYPSFLSRFAMSFSHLPIFSSMALARRDSGRSTMFSSGGSLVGSSRKSSQSNSSVVRCSRAFICLWRRRWRPGLARVWLKASPPLTVVARGRGHMGQRPASPAVCHNALDQDLALTYPEPSDSSFRVLWREACKVFRVSSIFLSSSNNPSMS